MTPRREPTFDEEKDCIFGLILLKTTHPDKDKTKPRLNEMEAKETRPGRDCPKNFHRRQDKFQNFVTFLVSSQMKHFGTVSSRSCPVCLKFTQSRLGLALIWMSSF